MFRQVRGLLLVLCALLMIGVSCSDDDSNNNDNTPKDPIIVRAAFDMTGGTSVIGKMAVTAIIGVVDQINNNGGINGHKIDLKWWDMEYTKDKSNEIYKIWQDEKDDLGEALWPKVSTVWVWGTDPTVDLLDELADDQKPAITTSYAGRLATPKKLDGGELTLPPDSRKVKWKADPGAPYIFFPASDYSTAIRIAMAFVKKQSGTKVSFAHASIQFGTEPIPAGRLYAKDQGLEILPDWAFCPDPDGPADDPTTPVVESGYVVAESVNAECERDNPDTATWVNLFKAAMVAAGMPAADAEAAAKKKPENIEVHRSKTDAAKGLMPLDYVPANLEAKVKAYFTKYQDKVKDSWVWIGNTRTSAAFFTNAVAKVSKDMNLNVKVIMGVHALDEGLKDECPGCPGVAFGVQSFANFGDTSSKGMKDVLELFNSLEASEELFTATDANGKVFKTCQKKDKDGNESNDAETCKNLRFIQGYQQIAFWIDAVKQLTSEGKEVTAENVKNTFESFKDHDTNELGPPLTFTAEDHRPSGRARIYSVEEGGVLKYKEDVTVELKAEWLGW